MKSCVDGTLTWSEFKTACIGFVERWKNTNPALPPWIWTPAPKHPLFHNQDDGYLSLENMCIVKSCEGSFHEIEEGEEQVGCVDEDESVDPATLVPRSCHNVHYYDFHIVYSSTYRVPVLYFRVYRSDGQPLALGELEKDLPPESAEALVKLKWTFITQEEHPYLNRPWNKLHPCGTGEWIKLLLESELSPEEKTSPELYLVSWLSVAGQVVGLKLPYEMLNREKYT